MRKMVKYGTICLEKHELMFSLLENQYSDMCLWSVTPQLVPRYNWSPGPSAANYAAVDGPPGPSMAAMDGPLCRKWSPCGKQEKQWLQLQIDLYSYTDR